MIWSTFTEKRRFSNFSLIYCHGQEHLLWLERILIIMAFLRSLGEHQEVEKNHRVCYLNRTLLEQVCSTFCFCVWNLAFQTHFRGSSQEGLSLTWKLSRGKPSKPSRKWLAKGSKLEAPPQRRSKVMLHQHRDTEKWLNVF